MTADPGEVSVRSIEKAPELGQNIHLAVVAFPLRLMPALYGPSNQLALCFIVRVFPVGLPTVQDAVPTGLADLQKRAGGVWIHGCDQDLRRGTGLRFAARVPCPSWYLQSSNGATRTGIGDTHTQPFPLAL